jgi:predicted RNA methylase
MEQRTAINAACLQQMLDSAANAKDKGQAQFQTPLAFGTLLASALTPYRVGLVDLNCGNGQLLYAAAHPRHTRYLLGLDIDPKRLHRPESITGLNEELRSGKITGDLTRTWQMFEPIAARFDCFALNPPWDLWWYREPLKDLANSDLPSVAEAFSQHDGRVPRECIDSTVATMMISLHLMQAKGEGFLIANAATMQRLVLADDAPHRALAQHIYAALSFTGNPMTGGKDAKFSNDGEFRTIVIYFARSHTEGLQFSEHFASVPASLPVNKIRLAHYGTDLFSSFDSKGNSQHLWWEAVAAECERQKQTARPSYNLWLVDGRIATGLTLYEQFDGRIDKQLAAALHSLQGKQPMQLVLKRSDRDALQQAAFGGVWRVQPQLQEAVRQAVQQYHANRAPIFPLPEVQRIGYLDEVDFIECKKDLRHEGVTLFRAGTSYPLATQTYEVKRKGKRINNEGRPESIEYSGSELFFYLTDEDGRKQPFIDGRLRIKDADLSAAKITDAKAETFSMQKLVDHFTIPEVLDVAAVDPDGFTQKMDRFGLLIADINTLLARAGRSIQAKDFQREGIVRAAMHHGYINGWDTGLGKTWATFLWPLLQVGWTLSSDSIIPREPVLITAPGDLHDQISLDEGWDNFRIRVSLIETQEDFYRLSQVNPATGRRELPPGFYITSYHQLSINGVRDLPGPKSFKQPDDWLAALNLSEADVIHEWNEAWREGEFEPGTPDCRPWNELDDTRKWQAKWSFAHRQREAWQADIGQEKNGITCVYSPSLSSLMADVFACVVVDEGTRLQGGFETDLAAGVMRMNPRYRCALSATPIKGRLLQVFWIVWWVCGGKKEPHARWPYAGTEEDKKDFARTYLVEEKNLTRKEDGKSGYTRLSPQVCNVHGLWKLLAPIVLRLRKQDAGEAIVKKLEHIIRVPFGRQQNAVYQYHLKAKYRTPSGHADPGRRMNALRMVAASPTNPKLDIVPHSPPGLPRSSSIFTPKLGAALNLIQQFVCRGEQVVVASFYREPLKALERLLTEAGVPLCLLDGDKSPGQRKPLSRRFKQGKEGGLAVNLSSIQAVAEGHNWFRCPNLIVLTYTWEADKMKQIVDRIWRLNSPKDVNIWKIICDGSVELRLDELCSEKTDAAELVLDGRLLSEPPKELNLWEITQQATANYDSTAKTIPEETIEAQWPKLKELLQQAAQLWRSNVVIELPPARIMTNWSALPQPVAVTVIDHSSPPPAKPPMPRWVRPTTAQA